VGGAGVLGVLDGRADLLPVLRDALGVRAAGILGGTDVAIEALPVDFRRLAGGAGVAGTSAWASPSPGRFTASRRGLEAISTPWTSRTTRLGRRSRFA